MNPTEPQLNFDPEDLKKTTAPEKKNGEGDVRSEKTQDAQGDLDLIFDEPEIAARPESEIRFVSDTNIYLKLIGDSFFSRDANQNNWIPDAGLQESFIKQIERANPGKPEVSANLHEVAKLLPKLGGICGDFRKKVFELADRGGKWEHVVENGHKILDSLLMSVAEGHITADDFTRLISNISVMKRADYAKRHNLDADSYEGVAFCTPDVGQIVMFEETLEDVFVKKNGDKKNLDFGHIISHELAHSVVESAIKRNPKIVAFAKHLMATPGLAPLLPLHVRDVLATEKEASVASAEIMADYTALYLSSDGSFREFFANCLNKAMLDGKDQFIAALQIDPAAWNAATKQGKDSRLALIESNPIMAPLIASYKELHSELASTLRGAKGRLVIQSDGTGAEYSEGSSGFGRDVSTGQEASRGNKGGVLDALGELANAVTSEVDPLKSV